MEVLRKDFQSREMLREPSNLKTAVDSMKKMLGGSLIVTE